MTFRRSAKDRSQLGCLGGAVCFLLWGLSKCNDAALWLPQWQANRARAAIAIGEDWPSALLAADGRLPRGKQLSASCNLANGHLVFVGRLGSKYTIHGCAYPDRDCDLKSGITFYANVSEWEMGLRELLLKPQLCQSLILSINRDYDVSLDLDTKGAVRSVSRVMRRD